MKLLLAVVRTTFLDRIVEELGRIGVRNMTILDVKGIGEQVTLFNPYAVHKELQIIVSDSEAVKAEEIILQFARSGFAGDGIIAVCPVDHVAIIKTEEKLQ